MDGDKSVLIKNEDKSCNASTNTSNGVIKNLWSKNNAFDTNDDEWWFSYVEITEFLFTNRKEKSCDNNIYVDEGGGDKNVKILPAMRKSLFPFVAPYVKFHTIDCKCKKLSSSISKYLKWKINGVTPKIVIQTIRKSGYKLITTDNWSGIWSSWLNDVSSFKEIKNYQKLNSFPSSEELGSKDKLWKNVRRMIKKFGLKKFGFVPETFVLPEDTVRLKEAWKKSLGSKWIVKPACSGRGHGIRVINQWWEVPKWHLVVVQRYIDRPKLINGSKFDLRIYVLVTSMNPLRVYLYNEGLVRFASVKYVNDHANLHDRFMHLTNTSVNKYSPNYVTNDSLDSTHGHKWSFKTLWGYLGRNEKVDVDDLWNRIKDLIIKTFISVEDSMCSVIDDNLLSNYNSYELYGFDVIIDEDYKPWLLEVNTLPSLHTDSLLDTAVKAPLIRNVLNIAGYQLPGNMTIFQERQLVKEFCLAKMRQDERIYDKNLCNDEIKKQNEFIESSQRADYILAILKNLTRDDIRQLLRHEDELTQIEKFEIIFPTNETHVYHKFFKKTRYYNLLLDAWEFQASRDQRLAGIERLKEFCSKKLHLQPASIS